MKYAPSFARVSSNQKTAAVRFAACSWDHARVLDLSGICLAQIATVVDGLKSVA